MGSLLKYELKKIIKRPFAFVVGIGAVVALAAIVLYASTQSFAYGWGPDIYGSYEAIPQKELARAHEDYGLTGRFDGTLAYSGWAANERDKENTRPFEGVWDDARLRQMAEDYLAFMNDPDHYSDVIDEWGTMMRSWNLVDQGMTQAEADAYSAANPLYEMKPEYQYGERQRWYTVSDLLENYVINSDGSINSFSEAFPLLGDSAVYEYTRGAQFTADFQNTLVGLLVLLILLAGVSPIFSDEVACHTEPMLLAAKFGRGKLIRAKICAGLLFSLAGLAVLSLLNVLLSGMVFGFSGYGVSLQLNFDTHGIPFALNYGQYLLVIIGLQALGLCAMAGLLMLLSSALRSAVPVVFTGAVATVICVMISNQNGDGWLRYFCQTLPPSVAIPVGMLYDGTKPGWGLLPLPQWATTIVVCVALLAVSLVLVMGRYRRARKV